MEPEVRPEIVLCSNTSCVHCVELKEGIPIEKTREPEWTPAFPFTYTHKCDRKNVVLSKDGRCDRIAPRHPDKMRPAVIRAKGQPSAQTLGIAKVRIPTVDERTNELWHKYFSRQGLFSMDWTDVHNSLIQFYLLGREDEKHGVKIDG